MLEEKTLNVELAQTRQRIESSEWNFLEIERDNFSENVTCNVSEMISKFR